MTFATVTDARVWLATVETDLLRGKWIDPTGGRVLLGDYAQRWMANRPDLANRTRERYAGLIKLTTRFPYRRRRIPWQDPPQPHAKLPARSLAIASRTSRA